MARSLRDNTAELHISICLHWVHREHSKGRNKKSDLWRMEFVFWDDLEVAGCKLASTTIFSIIKIFQSLFSQFLKKNRYNSFIFIIAFRLPQFNWFDFLMQKLVQKAQDVKVKLIISKMGKNTSYTKVVEEERFSYFLFSDFLKLRFL